MFFVDPARPNLGLKFDGRISEKFKLASGTWVRAANLLLIDLSHSGLRPNIIKKCVARPLGLTEQELLIAVSGVSRTILQI